VKVGYMGTPCTARLAPAGVRAAADRARGRPGRAACLPVHCRANLGADKARHKLGRVGEAVAGLQRAGPPRRQHHLGGRQPRLPVARLRQLLVHLGGRGAARCSPLRSLGASGLLSTSGPGPMSRRDLRDRPANRAHCKQPSAGLLCCSSQQQAAEYLTSAVLPPRVQGEAQGHSGHRQAKCGA